MKYAKNIIALRMQRQHIAQPQRQYLTQPAQEAEYITLYQDLQPGQNVYWNGFGDPPSLTYRAGFDDIEFNRKRQSERRLIKGRFAGGNLGWIMPEDLEWFAGLYQKPLKAPTEIQLAILELLEREGPLTIQQIKQLTGLLVKQITPILHRLQEAFLIYEDQNEGQDDRSWYLFKEMFAEVETTKHSRQAALVFLLQRFAYRLVWFNADMAKSFYKRPVKEIQTAVEELATAGVLSALDGGYVLAADLPHLQTAVTEPPRLVRAMHRNDVLVKSYEHILKEKYPHDYPDTLYYLLIDGEFRGAVAGKFRYTPEVEDVVFDSNFSEAEVRKDEILAAVHVLCGENVPMKRYQGEELL